MQLERLYVSGLSLEYRTLGVRLVSTLTNRPPVSAPPKLQSAGFPSDLSLGDDTVATCVVKKGSPGPFKMAWRKDGDELKNTNRVSVVSHVNSIALRVEGIQVDDIGNYTCSAANDFGSEALTLPPSRHR
ncbi:hypothetical protein MRX96_041937 [Rhipicephalus microplus]